MSLKKIFERELKEVLKGNGQQQTEEQFTAEDFANMPATVRNYLESCGYIGTPKYHNLLMHFEEASIKLKPDKNWLHLHCQQFNSAFPPVRIGLLESRLYGFVRFGAIDKYRNGKGTMHVKLAGFTIDKNTGYEMDRAALVTYLAESILLPLALVQNNINWEEKAENRVKANLTDAGMTVSGSFYFNSDNQLYEFRTDDRFYSDGKEFVNLTWSAYYEKYGELNGVRVPTLVRASWHMPGGKEFEYFRANIKNMDYNLGSTDI